MRGRRWCLALVLPLLATAVAPAAGAMAADRRPLPRIQALTIASDVALGGGPTPVPYVVVLTSPAARITVDLVDRRGRDVTGAGTAASPGLRRFAGSVSVGASSLPGLGGAHWVVGIWTAGGQRVASKTVAVHFRARGLVGISGKLVRGHQSVLGVARHWSAVTNSYVPLAGQAVEIGFVEDGVLQAFRYVRTDDRGRLATDVTGLHGTFVLVVARTATVSGAHSRALVL